MTKAYARVTSGSPVKAARDFSTIQPDLFAALTEPAVIGRLNAPDLDLGLELLGAVHAAFRAAKDSGLSRDRIVDRLNLAMPDLDRPVTKRALDSWTAQSREFHELPARHLAALCWACNSEEPLRVIAKALGYELVDRRESAAKRLGDLQIEIARNRREAGVITKTLGADMARLKKPRSPAALRARRSRELADLFTSVEVMASIASLDHAELEESVSDLARKTSIEPVLLCAYFLRDARDLVAWLELVQAELMLKRLGG